MSKRTSILLPDELYDRLRHRARQHSTTVSEEIREVLERDCQDDNPNQGWLDLAEAFKDVDWKPGSSIDSNEFKDEYVRWIYRDSFNREPDW